MKKIYLARDTLEAQLLVHRLEQILIPAWIENAHQAGGLGELAVTYPEVWIKRATDEKRARAFIGEYEASRKIEGKPQLCSQCGETNPASFDLCWACQSDLA